MATKARLEAQVEDLQEQVKTLEAAAGPSDELDVGYIEQQLRKHVFPCGGQINSRWTPRKLALAMLGLPPDMPKRCPSCTRIIVIQAEGADGEPGWCSNDQCFWNKPEGEAPIANLG